MQESNSQHDDFPTKQRIARVIKALSEYSAQFPGSPCSLAAELISAQQAAYDSLLNSKLASQTQFIRDRQTRKRKKAPKFRYDTPILERIYAMIEKDPNTGCWNWLGSGTNRYGIIRYARKTQFVHRLMYELTRNQVVQPGQCVRHDCDNSWCCNPDHLSIGTAEDNARDRTKRNRHGFAKLDLATAKQIRMRFAAGEPVSTLSTQYGVAESTVHHVGVGRSWKQLDDDPDIKALSVKKRHERWSPLTEESVRDIRRRLENGEPQKSIAERYGVNPSTISHINTRRKWSHIE